MKMLVIIFTVLSTLAVSASDFCVGIVIQPGYWLDQYYLTCGSNDLGVIDSEPNFTEEGTLEFKDRLHNYIEENYGFQYLATSGTDSFSIDIFSKENVNDDVQYCTVRVSRSKNNPSAVKCSDNALDYQSSSSSELLEDYLLKNEFVKAAEMGSLGPYKSIYSKILIYKKIK